MAKEKKQPIVGLPLSSDYQEGGIKYDPSQLKPPRKRTPKKKGK
jgi:hypothetical protein